MKRLIFILITSLLVLVGHAEDYVMTPDKSTTGSSSDSYITTLTKFTHNDIEWALNQWNPKTLQVKTNQDTQTSEFYIYNKTAFGGNITEVVLTFSALTLKNASESGWYLTPGTSEVGTSSLTTSGSVQGVWNSTNKTLTFTVSSEAQYFTIWQNGKVASSSNYLATTDAIKVTYTTSGGGATPTPPAAPTFSPVSGGTLTVGDEITITAATGNYIVYTLDGSDPTEMGANCEISDTNVKTITVTDAMVGMLTVKAVATPDLNILSDVATATYTVVEAADPGEGELYAYKTCLFGSSYNSGGVSSYDNSWTATNKGFTWDIANFNNNNNGWDYVKCGRKNNASVATITTSTSIDKAIEKIDITIDAITVANVNSIKVYTSTTSDFSTPIETIDVTKATGTQTATITSPAANLYYKIEFDCASGSGNGLVTVSKVEYFARGTAPIAVPTFSPSTGGTLTVGDEITITAATGNYIVYTIDGSDPTEMGANCEISGTNVETITMTAAMVGTLTVKAVATPDLSVFSDVSTATYTVVEAADPGEGELYAYKTCLFGSSYNSGGVSSYDNSWTATNKGFTWDIANFNNNNNVWNYVKCGRKNNASVATTTTSTSIDKAIEKIDITIDDITVANVNSITVYTSTTSDFSTPIETINVTKATGTQTATITSPAANLYYKIEFDCASGSGNGLVTVSKVEYFARGTAPIAVPTFSPSTGGTLTVGDEITITAATGNHIVYTIDGSDPTEMGANCEISGTNVETITMTAAMVGTLTVKAVATPDLSVFSDVSIATYTVEVLPLGEVVVDKLTSSCFPATNSNYKSFTNVNATNNADAVKSTANYAGATAKSNGAIQMPNTATENTDRKIYTTISGGTLYSVKVVWNAQTISGRKLNIYGSNTAFLDGGDVVEGELLTTLSSPNNATQTDFVYASTLKNYKYIGFAVTGGAAYFDTIEISWVLASIYERTVNPNKWGTICLEKGVSELGTTKFYEVSHKNDGETTLYLKLVDRLEAGMPYFFKPEENGSDNMTLMLTCDYEEPVVAAGHKNGLYGTLMPYYWSTRPEYDGSTNGFEENLPGYNVAEGVYMLSVATSAGELLKAAAGSWINKNRAYMVLSEVPDTDEEKEKDVQLNAPRYVSFGIPDYATDAHVPLVNIVDDANKDAYDMSGRRVTLSGHGLFIVNGKKVVK